MIMARILDIIREEDPDWEEKAAFLYSGAKGKHT